MKAAAVLPQGECSIAVSEVTARYRAVPSRRRGIMRGVLENGVLRRYGVGDLGNIRGGRGLMREHDLHCIRDFIEYWGF